MTALPILQDATPNDDEESEVSQDDIICEKCLKPIYRAPGTRGRKPRFHDECKPSGGSKSMPKKATPASDTLAEQAASMLGMANTLMGAGLAFFGLPLTGEQIKKANEDFEEMAKSALLTDPKLCRKILSAGGTSGAAGLCIAYAALGAQVAPVALMEFKTRKAQKELDNGNDSDV